MGNDTIPQLSIYGLTDAHLPFADGVILQRKRGFAPHLGVVLASFPDRIVVWTVNLQDAYRERGGGFYNGAYFGRDELTDAVKEYSSR